MSSVSPPVARGAEGGEIEDLKREIRQLQAQVAALRSAIIDAAEFDRQRAALLTKALKNIPAVSDAPAPSLPPPKAEPASRPVASAARRAAPPPPPPEPSVGTIRGKIAVPSGEPVAYVYVENVLAPSIKGQHKTIEQSGKKFVPGWAVVQRGTTVDFPNRDNIYHNVFSMSAGNSFDLGLYNSDSDGKSHTFTEAGPVDVYCNIHPAMAASVLVVPNRHYAKVKADGTFELPSVPAGRRKVVAWSPGSRSSADWVEVAGGQTVDVNLKLDSKTPGHKNKSGQAYGSYE
jgi:plastocyanin